MWSFLFHRSKIRSTRKAEMERQYFQEANRFFINIQNSDKQLRYEELKLRVNRAEFKEKVRELSRFTWRPRKSGVTWKESEEYKALTEYHRLAKDKELKRYSDLKEDRSFGEYRNWELVFEDYFSELCLNSSKWITRYYAGEFLLNDTYAVGNDVQLFKPGNVMMRDGRLCLEFRKEDTEGKYWDPSRGVVSRRYAYTSGLISTALSFRQGQGRFEAKIQVCDAAASLCFWLAGDGLFPHINVMKIDQGHYDAGCMMPDGEEKNKKGLQIKLRKGSYIFTLDRTLDELIWKINDCIVKREKNRLPDTPLYAVFSVGSVQPLPDKQLPVRMYLEWVRFYKK